MVDGCNGFNVDVHIGHVVIPRASLAAAGACAAVVPSVEPALKIARSESIAGLHNNNPSWPADIVTVAAWSEECIADALRRYAVAALEAASQGAAEGSAPFSSTAAAAAVLTTVKNSARSWVAAWPAVRLSLIPATETHGGGEAAEFAAAGWSALQFSFVPAALELSDPASAAGGHLGICRAIAQATASAVDDTTTLLRVLAAIPLPRALRVPYQGTTVTATAGSRAGCVSAVLTEHVQVHADTATPPPAWSSGQHPPVSMSMRSPCIDVALPAELRARPLLLVGAGGIGCEVLKVLVLSGFTNIHLIDLDTIDATNLNRQFLFQAEDVGRSKAETARRVVLDWFAAADSPTPAHVSAPPSALRTLPCVVAYHDNVTADRYDNAFYKQFAAVLSALDNVSARQHVNRMCMRNDIPLIESGTMGYNGQVQPILKNVYECYDCRPKPQGTKTFAVCTIHARPTTMVHCVHYAKELYETLFGGDPPIADGAEANAFVASGLTAEPETVPGQNKREVKGQSSATAPNDGGELSYLRTMVSDWRNQLAASSPGDTGAPTCSLAETSSTLSPSGSGSSGSGGRGEEGNRASSAAALAAQLLRLLFVTKIEALLSMKSSWSTEPPVPLSRCDIDSVEASHGATSVAGAPPASVSGDRVLSVQECVKLFLSSMTECLARPSGVMFRKEDDAAVRFVSAVANLRAHVFHIAPQSLEEVRGIAGSIIPAIATTNAMIAGAVVHELIPLLRCRASQMENTTAAQAAPLLGTGVAGRSSLLSTNPSPPAHVVYARKAPQSRRRRVPLPPPGQRRLAPALFMEYTDDHDDIVDGSPSPNGVALSCGACHAPLRTALAMVGAENSTADLLQLYSAAKEGGGDVWRGAAVTDHYVVHSTRPNPPNRTHCLVCQDVHPEVSVSLNLRTATLSRFVHVVLEDALGMEAPSVSYGSTVLYEDEDYEVLAHCTLADVLQLPPPNAEQATPRQGYTLTVDALNKNVAWSVILVHDDINATTPTLAPSAPSASLEVSGLEQAMAAEQRALARLAAQQGRQEPLGEVDEEASNSPPPAATAIPPVVMHIVSDDDDDNVKVAPVMSDVMDVVSEKEVVEVD
ncbi:hypothetical protein JKF63_02796 [Porcisia hertigi]|uniref:Ubiquitin-activating enzyme-like protein n=1 Tax=Porcisia hertigi TaxID=2761500 RepID=A0A836I7Z5_9TRYP|nr:hypothetical protein JKF63_02796 [Porcisia hertigi]